MAGRKRKSSETKFTGFQEINKLWTSVSPQDWLQLFQELAPELNFQAQSNSTIKCKCPYHSDLTPSLHLTFNKHFGKCFGCDKVIVDLVNFVAKLKTVSYTEALMLLNSRFNLGDLLGEKSATDLITYNNIQEMKKSVAMAANRILDETIRDTSEYLAYCKPAVAYLIKGRELPGGVLSSLPVGVFAKPEHMKKYIDPEYHELYDTYFKDYMNNSFFGSIMFHFNSGMGLISRFKLKKIDLAEFDKIKHVDKYMNLSKEVLRNLYSKVFAYVPDPYTERLGVFGLNFYSKMLGRGDSNCYITEGEFDVLSTMAKQLIYEKMEFMVLGTGGTGSTNMSFLKEFDIRTLWVIGDTPAKNGDEYVKSIIGDKNNYEQSINNRSLHFKIFTWPREINGLDLDEAMQLNDFNMMSKFLYTERTSTFLNLFPWIADKCDKEIQKVKLVLDDKINLLDSTSDSYAIEFSNITDDKRNKIKDIVVFWLNYIKEPTDRSAFVQRYKSSEDIDLDKLDSITTAMYALDTYSGVVQKLVDETLKYFTPAYYEKKATAGEVVTMWARKSENMVELYGNDKNVYDLIAQHIGKPIINWFDELLPGNPVYLDRTGVSEMEDAVTKRKNARNLMQHVWEHLRCDIKYLGDLTKFSQGIQYSDLPPAIRSQNYCYFINGKLVFKGKFLEDNQMEWERIHGVTDGELLFTNITNTEKWSSVQDVTDLYEANSVDLLQVYKSIRTILAAWKFKDDEVYQEYLAAYIMSIPIMRAIGAINILFINGDRESGKTSLINGLLGGGSIGKGVGLSIESLLECTKFQNNLSAASLYQTYSDKGLLCVIDEAESSPTNSKHQNDQIQAVWELMYSLPMGTGSHVSRGGVTKDQRVEYNMRMPVLMAATQLPKDPTFRSRILFINTVKEPGRTDPVEYISNKFDMEKFPKLKRDITIGLIPRIPELIQLKSRLKQTLPAATVAIDILSNRFVDCVLTPLTVYEYIGAGNAIELYKRIVGINKDRLISLHGVDTQSEIINACLYSESIKIINDAGASDKVSAKSLILSGDINMLNNFKSGIYLVPEQGWIILVWRQIKYTTLRHQSFYYMSEATLKEVASKNMFVENDISDEEHFTIVDYLGLADVKSPLEYTVVNREYLIRSDLLKDKPKYARKKELGKSPRRIVYNEKDKEEGVTEVCVEEKEGKGEIELNTLVEGANFLV